MKKCCGFLWHYELPSVILSHPNFMYVCKYIIDIVLLNSNILRKTKLETGYAR